MYCGYLDLFHREHLFVCADCTGPYIGVCRTCLFASGWVRTHAIGISRVKMAVVAVSLVTFPDSLVTLLVEIHKYAFGDINSLHKVKEYLLINKKSIIVRVSAFWSAWFSSARRRLAPPMNVESDIMQEKMHGKQTETRLGTRPPAYYDVTGIYQHIPPGHANEVFPTEAYLI